MTFALRATSDVAQLQLIRAGAGIGFCQEPLANRDGLARVVAKAFHFDLGLWLVMHENLRSAPRCRAVFTDLAEAFQEYLDVKGARSRPVAGR